LTVLLLIAAAFGVGGAGLTVARFAQDTVCASDRQGREPRRISEQQAVAVTPLLPVHRAVPRRELAPADVFVSRELFQRPPPDSLSFV